MKLILLDSDGQILEIIEHIQNPEATFSKITWEGGFLDGIKTDFVFLEDGEEPLNLTEKMLIQYKEMKKQECKNHCENLILSGFYYGGHHFEYDYKDQQNFTQQMYLLLLDPTIQTIDWKTSEGIISFNRDEFIQICREGESNKRSYMESYWECVEKIDQLNDCSSIKNFEKERLNV